MANPELVEVSDDDAAYEEGCLSLPEHYGEVVRPAKIRVRFLDRENEIREMDAEGLLATCIQHEMDHLDGILFVDHLTALKRNMILRKLLKAKKSSTPLASYRSEEHTSELQSLMRISYAVFCLKKKKQQLHSTQLRYTTR